MNDMDNRKNAHQDIDHIFKELLPAQGMKERSEQLLLSHRMLEAMLDGSIALCDAGTGIGKTFAYLVAGIAVHRYRAASQAWHSSPSLSPLPASPCSGRC